jgi:predicted phage terminase large subunit-like protein
MLFLPPRHGKSELVTVRYPIFRLEQNPELRVIIGAYNQQLAERFSRKGRRVARQRLSLSRERATAGEWETEAGGGIRAVGVGAGVTGLGADLILIDDPVKSREEAESQTYRDRVWDWYRDDLYTRQEPNCAIILVMTRWHEDDLAGRILASEEGPSWRVVRIPALAEAPEEYEAYAERRQRTDRTLVGAHAVVALDSPHHQGVANPSDDAQVADDPAGILFRGFPPDSPVNSLPGGAPFEASDPVQRTPGQALWPSRFNEAALARIQTTLGPRSFAALYQGRPLPAEGGLFKRAWFNVVESLPESDSGPRRVRFWDTAAKAGQRSDYWAGALLARLPGGEWYLEDVIRGRWEYPQAKRRVLEIAARDGQGVPVVIEDSANGIALLQDLAASPAADGFCIRAEKVTAEKAVRAGAWASAAESGRFHLLRGPWNAAFLTELETFPHGAHDDQVDAVSGAFGYLTRVSRIQRPISFAGPSRPAGIAAPDWW